MARKPALIAAAVCLGVVGAAGGVTAAASGAGLISGPGRSSLVSGLTDALAGLAPRTAATQPSSFRVFTASGSFTIPTGVARMTVEVRGAGGGGGPGANGGNGSGGGPGGWERVLVNVKSGSVYVVTVGTGGSGGTTGRGGTGGATIVHLRGKTAFVAEATGGDGGFPGESCAVVAQDGPLFGGIGGLGLPPTDPASLGLNAEVRLTGSSSSYLSASCPSTPFGGTGGGANVAGAGGAGGPGTSSGPGAGGHAGVALVFFLR